LTKLRLKNYREEIHKQLFVNAEQISQTITSHHTDVTDVGWQLGVGGGLV